MLWRLYELHEQQQSTLPYKTNLRANFKVEVRVTNVHIHTQMFFLEINQHEEKNRNID